MAGRCSTTRRCGCGRSRLFPVGSAAGHPECRCWLSTATAVGGGRRGRRLFGFAGVPVDLLFLGDDGFDPLKETQESRVLVFAQVLVLAGTVDVPAPLVLHPLA